MSKLSDYWWIFTDLIFPRIRQLSPIDKKNDDNRCQSELAAVKKLVTELPDTEKRLKDYLASVTELLELEKARKQSIEARLTSIIGLTSIAGTIVFGGLVAQIAGTLHVDSKYLKWLLALGAFYLTLQLCSSLLAAVRGVSRSSYISNKTSDLIPTSSDTIASFLKKKIISASEMYADHQYENNSKISHMAVAHQAMKNFVIGLLVFASSIALSTIFADPKIKEDVGSKFAVYLQQPDRNLLLTHVARIGPFASGESKLSNKESEACVISLLRPYRNDSRHGWQLVAGLDKQNLKPNLVKVYGSNYGLAMARAAWVRDVILNGVQDFHSEQAILNVAGPMSIGSAFGKISLESDRMVDIFVWQNQSPNLSTPELLKPKVCH